MILKRKTCFQKECKFQKWTEEKVWNLWFRRTFQYQSSQRKHGGPLSQGFYWKGFDVRNRSGVLKAVKRHHGVFVKTKRVSVSVWFLCRSFRDADGRSLIWLLKSVRQGKDDMHSISEILHGVCYVWTSLWRSGLLTRWEEKLKVGTGIPVQSHSGFSASNWLGATFACSYWYLKVVLRR